MHDGRMGVCMHKMLKDCSGRTLGSTHESCISGLYFSRDVARPSCMHRRVIRGLQKAATRGSRSTAVPQQAVRTRPGMCTCRIVMESAWLGCTRHVLRQRRSALTLLLMSSVGSGK